MSKEKTQIQILVIKVHIYKQFIYTFLFPRK